MQYELNKCKELIRKIIEAREYSVIFGRFDPHEFGVEVDSILKESELVDYILNEL